MTTMTPVRTAARLRPPSPRRLPGLLAAHGAGAALGFTAMALMTLVVLAAGGMTLAGAGLVLLLAAQPLLRGHANVSRRWAGRVTGVPIAPPYRPMARGPLTHRVRALLADPATWRDAGWQFVCGVYVTTISTFQLALIVGAVAEVLTPLWWHLVPLVARPRLPLSDTPVDSTADALVVGVQGVMVLAVAYLLLVPLARAAAAPARWLLGETGRTRLTRWLESADTGRQDAVDLQAAELRRVERDLHDGAQARIAALAMGLGLAEDQLAANPELAAKLLSEARGSATQALDELRDLVRGIHPPVLAERGLPDAVRELALRVPFEVRVDAAADRRLPPPVESAAYFVVSEALANVVKHAVARTATIELADDGDALAVLVTDDGRGGADPARGTGLRGIQRRVSALTGTFDLHSPAGGPTVLTARLPFGRTT